MNQSLYSLGSLIHSEIREKVIKVIYAVEFRQDEDFMVVMWRKEGATTGDEGVNGELNELNSSQKATLRYIKENEGCTATEISDKIGVPFSTIDKHIRILLKKGIIERRGSKKTGGYYIKKIKP